MLAAEHGGRWKIMELVTRNYWWPGVIKDVEKYVNSCDMCQSVKIVDGGLYFIFIFSSYFIFLFFLLFFYF